MGEINRSTVMVKISITDRNYRKKFGKYPEDSTNTINQIDLINNYRTLYQQ